jgi:hypothetical protein
MPAGRPTSYKPEYCQEVIIFLGQGHSLKAFAGHIKTSADTVFEWVHQHPEFSDSVKKGRAACVKWYEQFFKAMAAGQIKPSDGGKTNAAAAIFLAKNIIGWKDRLDIEGQVQVSVDIQHRLEGSTKIELIALAKEAIELLEAKKKPIVIDLPKQLSTNSDRT